MNARIVMMISVSSAFIFSGCGGNAGLVPAGTSVNGPLGDYFRVVERTYNVKDDYVGIEFERISEGLPSPWKENIGVGYSENKVEPCLKVDFMDEYSDVVCSDRTDIVWDKDDLTALVALGVGETCVIRFNVDEKDAVSFKVMSTFEYHAPSPESKAVSVDDDSEADDTQSDSENWDDLLDKYEEFVDAYVSAYKKAMSGDLSAMTDYAGLLEKATELSEELDESSSEMTASQLSRYMKITGKMTTGIL